MEEYSLDEYIQSGFDIPPLLIKSVPPKIPKRYRNVRIKRMVLLKVYIDPDGKVVCAEVIKSDVPDILETCALNVVMKWKFSPARRKGVSVFCKMIVPVRFNTSNR